jgi:hypothetical protein
MLFVSPPLSKFPKSYPNPCEHLPGPQLKNIYIPQLLLASEPDQPKQQQRRYNKKGQKEQHPAQRTATYVEQCFRIVKVLGHGAFGEVLLIVDVEVGDQEWALKRSRRLYTTANDRLRQLREVQNFDIVPLHSNIVQLHVAFEEKVG